MNLEKNFVIFRTSSHFANLTNELDPYMCSNHLSNISVLKDSRKSTWFSRTTFFQQASVAIKSMIQEREYWIVWDQCISNQTSPRSELRIRMEFMNHLSKTERPRNVPGLIRTDEASVGVVYKI